jgi:hypothetical protein
MNSEKGVKSWDVYLLLFSFTIMFLIFLSGLSLHSEAQVTETPITIVVLDVKPKVRWINFTGSPGAFSPQTGTFKQFNAWAVINDAEANLVKCNATLWNATFSAGQYSDANRRYINSSCNTWASGDGLTCNCTFYLYYYDVNGTWVVNITGYDSNDRSNFNSTQFSVAELYSSDLQPPTPIEFGSLLVGYNTQAATSNPTRINNTGNAKLSVFLNGTDFTGVTNPSVIIGVGNLTHNTTGSGTLQKNQNAPLKYDPTGGVPVYPNKIPNEVNASTFILKYYMDIPSFATEQTYTANYMFNITRYGG